MISTGPLHFSYIADYVYGLLSSQLDFCPVSDPDVNPSVFVCDVEHTCFQFGRCITGAVANLFCACFCTIMSQLGAHINELYVPVYSGRRTCCLE